MPMNVRYNMKNWHGLKVFSKEVNVSIIYAYEEDEILGKKYTEIR
jgi:hypothetical protein